MDAIAIVAVVIDWWNDKKGIKHIYKVLASSHCFFQTVYIVEDRPCVMPGIALSEGSAPFVWTERLLEGPVRLSASHEIMGRIEYIFPVAGPLLPFVKLLLRPSHLLRHLKDAPVIIGIFKGTGHIFMDAAVVWNITDGIIMFMSKSAGRIGCRVDIFSAMDYAII
jgi:hypothetical protein